MRKRWYGKQEKRTLVKGISWRVDAQMETLEETNNSETNFLEQDLPDGIFIIDKNSTTTHNLTFGYEMVNGLLCKIMFTQGSNRILCNIGDITVFDLEFQSISKWKLLGILRYVSILKPCNGAKVDKENHEAGMPDSVKAQSCGIVCEPLAENCKPCRQQLIKLKRKVKSKHPEQHDKVPKLDEISPKSKKFARKLKTLPDKQRSFIENQVENATRHPQGRRYLPQATELAMSIFTRNPRALENVNKSGLMTLPSNQHLSRIKNTIKQSPGINEGVLEWMRLIALEEKRPDCDYSGGLLLDEMKVQEDIELKKSKNGTLLTGMMAQNGELNMISHVLQFLYVGLGGFVFPVAHFPTVKLTHTMLYDHFWSVLKALRRKNFNVKYCMLDGASTNRSFINMQISTLSKPMTVNVIDPAHNVIFIQDPSHVIKKIRNSILNSGDGQKKTRHIHLNGHPIVWEMWVSAYLWDNRTHGLNINHSLTDQHLYPTDSEKMRNHLAFECLDKDMLHLMQMYQQNVNDTEREMLNAPIKLLEHTSVLVDFFKDERPITCLSDTRLAELKNVGKWFKTWEEQVETEYANDKVLQNKALIAPQTRQDIEIMVSGILALAKVTVDAKIPLIPAKTNSDLIENFFSEERGIYHGCNSHPSYGQYMNAINSTILCRHTLSKKSNCSSTESSCYSSAAKKALKNVNL